MTGEKARKELKAIQPDDDVRAEELARQIETDCRDPLAWLARTWAAGAASSDHARTLLKGMQELSIAAWVTEGRTMAGPKAVEAFREAAEGYGAFQERVVQKLKNMLDDKSDVPVPKPVRPVEERDPSRRVCDEAYLLLRKLLKGDESAMTQEDNEQSFLRQEVQSRDGEIRRHKTTGAFSPSLQG